ncbi:hypothetical protein [Halobacillus seohaensis]|uniref:Uncharacterized protein n=1 Tax=Halobacillus seohaensis TaxID=447421 RepID=A0ABW2EQC5_9BACI
MKHNKNQKGQGKRWMLWVPVCRFNIDSRSIRIHSGETNYQYK